MASLSQLSNELLTMSCSRHISRQERMEIYDEVHRYITHILERYFNGETLERAIRIFDDFAHGNIGNVGDGITTTPPELTTKDAMHFCWNIWNRLRPINRKNIPRYLKRVFPHLFHDISESSIYYKMTNDDGTFTIPIIKSGKLFAELTTIE
jgi:hypothetical protein